MNCDSSELHVGNGRRLFKSQVYNPEMLPGDIQSHDLSDDVWNTALVVAR